MSEVVDHTHHRQQFPLSGAIILLGISQRLAGIGHHVLHSVMDLRQHSANPITAGVCVEYKLGIHVWIDQEMALS